MQATQSKTITTSHKILKSLTLMAVALLLVFGSAGKASAFTPMPHWRHRLVYIENHASHRWPVARAADDLDNGSGLVLRVVKRCPVNSQCIRVYGVRSLPGTQIGQTYDWPGSDDRTVKAQTTLDNSWGNRVPYVRRLSLVEHELGHAVGLNHSSRYDTCMRAITSMHPATHIDAQERAQLRRWYGR